jgi:hypothetical protein
MQHEPVTGMVDDVVSEVRISITRDMQRLVVAGKVYEELKQGETLNLPYWAASKLVEAGLAQYSDKILDAALLAQIAWRERRSVAELTELPPKFYGEARRLLRRLRDTQPESVRIIERNLWDIVSIRISKLLSYASKNIPIDRIKNISQEEAALYLEVRKLLDTWLQGVGVVGGGND